MVFILNLNSLVNVCTQIDERWNHCTCLYLHFIYLVVATDIVNQSLYTIFRLPGKVFWEPLAWLQSRPLFNREACWEPLDCCLSRLTGGKFSFTISFLHQFIVVTCQQLNLAYSNFNFLSRISFVFLLCSWKRLKSGTINVARTLSRLIVSFPSTWMCSFISPSKRFCWNSIRSYFSRQRRLIKHVLDGRQRLILWY